MRVPPVVTYRTLGSPAYLLTWEQHPDRTWWAQILWVVITQEGHAGRHARVAATDVAPIDGQDYRTVPRRRLVVRHRLPGDPTDPSHRREAREARQRALSRDPETDS